MVKDYNAKYDTYNTNVVEALKKADNSVDEQGAVDAIKNKTAIAALVSPVSDYANLAAATAAIKSIIDALKA